jgi:hypothetical protein
VDGEAEPILLTRTLIYLDEQQSAGNSWLFHVKVNGETVPVTLYENDKNVYWVELQG